MKQKPRIPADVDFKRMSRTVLRDLIELTRERDISELAVEWHGLKIGLKKTLVSQMITEDSIEQSAEKAEVKLLPITSPYLGLFHFAVEPGEEDNVMPGEKIERGQLLGYVDQMRLMQEVVSPEDGILRDILISEGAPVEYGQTLFLIEPLEDIAYSGFQEEASPAY